MQQDEFIEAAQGALPIEARERVEEIVEAVLWTLAGRLERAARDDVAAQLGGQLKGPFERRDEKEIIPLEEFHNRISARANLNLVEAQTYPKAVVETLRSALTEGEYSNMVEELPSEYAEWLGAGEARQGSQARSAGRGS